MAGADADRISLTINEEETYGTAPTGAFSGTITTVTQSTKTYAAAAGLDVFSVGQTVLIAGCANADSNGYKTVASAGATALVVEEAIGADEASATATIKTAYDALRITSESLGLDIGTQESNEIESSGNVVEIRKISQGVTGDIGFDFSYGGMDKLLEGAWRSSWSSAVTSTAITYSTSSVDNSINDSGSGFVSAGYTANQWIQISGFTTAANNCYAKISTVAAGKMVLTHCTLVTESAGDSVTINMGSQLTNGTTNKSYAAERTYNDLSSEIALFTGLVVDGFSLTGGADNIITGTVSFMGQDESSETTSQGTGTIKAANTNAAFSGIADVTGIFEGGSSMGVTNLSLTVANGARPRNVMGTEGAESMGKGRFRLSGTFSKFYESKTIMDKFLAYTSSSLALVLTDTAGNGYVIDMPEMKYTSGRRVAGGTESDIIAEMGFTATRDTSELITARIARFDA